MKVAIGVAGVILCLVITAYYATAAPGHPRIKHMLLFLFLAGASALFAWFSLPPRNEA
jgi:hypothetical protein